MDKDDHSLVTFEVVSTAAPAHRRDGNFVGAGSIAGQLAQIDIGTVSAEISRIVDQLAAVIRPRPGGPCQCEVAFGVKVSADAGVIISKIGGEASLNVKVVWDRT